MSNVQRSGTVVWTSIGVIFLHKSVKMGKTGKARSKRVSKSARISGPAASCNNGSNLEKEKC